MISTSIAIASIGRMMRLMQQRLAQAVQHGQSRKLARALPIAVHLLRKQRLPRKDGAVAVLFGTSTDAAAVSNVAAAFIVWR